MMPSSRARVDVGYGVGRRAVVSLVTLASFPWRMAACEHGRPLRRRSCVWLPFLGGVPVGGMPEARAGSSERAAARRSDMKAAIKRVYTSVGVRALAENSKRFAVTLDGRDLRTPARKVLELPTKELALGVALEWEAQREHVRPETMPLMKLASTTVDQVPDIRSTMVDSMLRCLQSDLTRFRSSDEPALMAKEEAAYAPIIAWTADTLQLKLNVTDSMVLTHPPEAIPRAEVLLADADDWCVRRQSITTHPPACHTRAPLWTCASRPY